MKPTIQFREVTYSVTRKPSGTSSAPSSFDIVSAVSLEIHAGETVVLLGRSGSGKTTLLRLINRLLVPQKGAVFVQDRATSDWDPIALRRGIGYVIQEGGLFPHFTVAQNISLVPTLENWDCDADQQTCTGAPRTRRPRTRSVCGSPAQSAIGRAAPAGWGCARSGGRPTDSANGRAVWRA